jgi:hypothetical protein
MASKSGLTDSQADALVTVVVVFTLVVAAIYWVSTAG